MDLLRKKLYGVWKGMRERCFDSRHDSYQYYGGKGITICEEWSKFEPFYQWALTADYNPSLRIDRRESTGNYEPGNCRFVTVPENNRNRSNVKLTPAIAADIRAELERGAVLNHLAIRYGVNPGTIHRIKTGKNWKPAQQERGA